MRQNTRANRFDANYCVVCYSITGIKPFVQRACNSATLPFQFEALNMNRNGSTGSLDGFEGFSSDEDDFDDQASSPSPETSPTWQPKGGGIKRSARRMSGNYGFSGSFTGIRTDSTSENSFEYNPFASPTKSSVPTGGGLSRTDSLTAGQRQILQRQLQNEAAALEEEAARLEREVLELANASPVTESSKRIRKFGSLRRDTYGTARNTVIEEEPNTNEQSATKDASWSEDDDSFSDDDATPVEDDDDTETEDGDDEEDDGSGSNTKRCCDECDELKSKGWSDPAIDEELWFCEDCWNAYNEDGLIKDQVITDDEQDEEEDDQFESNDGGDATLGVQMRRRAPSGKAIPLKYLGCAFATVATLKAATGAFKDVQAPEIAAFAQDATFQIEIDLVKVNSLEGESLYAVAAANIERATQIPEEPQTTVAIFSRDPNLNFMVCHLVTARDKESATKVVDRIDELVRATQNQVHRQSMSMSSGGGGGARRQSIRYANKTAVAAPTESGGHRRAYSFARHQKVARKTSKEIVPEGASSVDLSKPIGLFKCTYLGNVGSKQETGHDAATAAINKFVEMNLLKGSKPTDGALAITLSGFDVIDMTSSEVLAGVTIQNVSFVSVVDSKKILAPLKTLNIKGWNQPLLVVIRNKSMQKGKRIPICELISLGKGASAPTVLKLLKGAAASAATRHANRRNAFDADPNTDDSEEIFLGDDVVEIPRQDLDCQRVLGKGEYGEVFLAKYKKNEVAVKLAKPHVSLKDAGAFLGEAEIMAPLKHPNILELLGVAVRQKPWLIVLEYCDNGDLKDLLKSLARRDPPVKLTNLEQMYISYQIAAACEYIHEKRLIHMDIAARNCLIQGESKVKVADFGVAQSYDDGKDTWLQTVNMKLPGRWLAPETLTYSTYSEGSDCWAFGTTMWEIASYGELPFKNITLSNIKDHINAGGRNEQPPGCDDDFYALIMTCWCAKRRERPKFSQLVSRLKAAGSTWASRGQDLRDIGVVAASAKGKMPKSRVAWVSTGTGYNAESNSDEEDDV